MHVVGPKASYRLPADHLNDVLGSSLSVLVFSFLFVWLLLSVSLLFPFSIPNSLSAAAPSPAPYLPRGKLSASIAPGLTITFVSARTPSLESSLFTFDPGDLQ